jgi:hypothetical protein
MRWKIAVAAVVGVSAVAGAQTGVNGVSLRQAGVGGSGSVGWSRPDGTTVQNVFSIGSPSNPGFASAGPDGPNRWRVSVSGVGSTGGGVIPNSGSSASAFIFGELTNGTPSATITGSA